MQSVSQEVFDMIAQSLHWKDFITLTQVSTELNTLVRSSSKFLNSTIFTINCDAMKNTKMIQRSYRNVTIDSLNILLATDSAIQFSGKLRKIKLNGCIIVDVQDLFHLLNNLSLSYLEDLEIENVKIVDKKSIVTQKDHLKTPKLINLSVSSSEPEWILHFIKDVTHLSSLKISRTKDFKGKSDFLIRFINKLEILNCLDLTFVNFYEVSLSSEKLKPKLQLNELKLRDMSCNSMHVHSTIASMFQCGEKLTALGNCHENLISNALLPSCFKSLKYLNIEMGYLLNEAFMDNLNQFNEVHTLLFSGEYIHPRMNGDRRNTIDKFTVKEVMSHFKFASHLQLPKTLMITNCTADDLVIDSPFVKSLTIDFFRAYLVRKPVTLPSLEQLEIRKFHKLQYPFLVNFIERHPKICAVKVHVVKDFEDFETISREIFKSLHTIVVSGEVFEIINGKKTYRMCKREIELQEYGRHLDFEGRKKLSQEWKEEHRQFLESDEADNYLRMENVVMEVDEIDKIDHSSLIGFKKRVFNALEKHGIVTFQLED